MHRPHVCILMATVNGAAHLHAQLESFVAQEHDNWSLLVSDDNSTDATRDIIRQFAAAHPKHDVQLIAGPGQGTSAANFLSLLERCDLPREAFVAFSDQDDVWMADKLGRAVAHLLGTCPSDRLGLYAGRTILVSEDLQEICVSHRHPKPPSFGNSLVQNILAGNTIVLNGPAARLAKETAAAAREVPYHDWWLYQLIVGVGAQVVIDDTPCLYYRQHGRNEMGANRGLRHAISRLSRVFRHEYGAWIDCNLAALEQVSDRLTEQNRAKVQGLAAFRENRIAGAHSYAALRRLGIRRQSCAGNIVLWLATLLGRF